MLFLALIQNDAHAETPSSIIRGTTDISADTQTSSEYQLFPYFAYLQHIQGFDMDSDDSLQRFLNTDHPFADKNYIPVDLVAIESDFTANNSRSFMLRQEAAMHFADMAWNFRHDFSGDRILLTSAYRSKSLQDYLLNKGCSSLKCAQ